MIELISVPPPHLLKPWDRYSGNVWPIDGLDVKVMNFDVSQTLGQTFYPIYLTYV